MEESARIAWELRNDQQRANLITGWVVIRDWKSTANLGEGAVNSGEGAENSEEDAQILKEEFQILKE